jgi:hypothetical protein
MSVTFRYIQTGQTVTFTQQVDIDSMKGHPEYERIEEQAAVVVPTPVPAKKMGRPSKAEQLAQLEAMQ